MNERRVMPGQYAGWGAVFAALFFISSPGPGFSAPSSPAPAGSFALRSWEVGQTITLRTRILKDNRLASAETTTYSIVEEEKVDGKDYLWVEIENVRQGGVTITQKLQVRRPGPLDFLSVLTGDVNVLNPRRKLQKISLGPTKQQSSFNELEVDPAQVKKIEEGPAPTTTRDLSGLFTITPQQSTKVKAGKFGTTRFQVNPEPTPTPQATPATSAGVSQSMTAWGTPELPIWGYAKRVTQVTGGQGGDISVETEVVAFGDKGAVSKLKGKPYRVSFEKRKKLSKDGSRDKRGDSRGRGKR